MLKGGETHNLKDNKIALIKVNTLATKRRNFNLIKAFYL